MPGGSRLRAVPGFVVLFVVAIGIASLDVIPGGGMTWIDRARTLLLAAALFAIGTRVDVRRLARLGARPLALGLGSWALIAGVAYLGVLVAW
jgi:uncharacterized membrane protein YadS